MAQLRIDFQGRGEVETFSWARIQPMGDGVQLALGIARQVRALGQVLAQQAIGVLVGAALPRAVRIGKEDPDRQPLRQALVLGHLFPAIIGQRFAQQRGHVPEFLCEALSGTRRIRPLHPYQDDQARRPLHQGADGRAIAGPLDEVAFPVARHGAGGHLGGALGNRRHVGNLAAAIRPSRPRPARLARLTQRGQQFAPQGAAWQHIQRRIDGLGREVSPHVVRIRASEAPGNLFGRAALSQVYPDVLPQPGGHEFPRPPRLTCPGCCQCLRRAGPIESAPRYVAGQLTAHGAGGRAPTPTPSSSANGRGPDPGSRSHVLQHSCVYRISLAWQHRSPSGLEVLHLELELKNQDVALIRLRNEIHPYFFAAWFNSLMGKQLVEQRSTGRINPFLGLGNLRGMPFPALAPRDHQRIGNMVQDMVEKAYKAEHEASKLLEQAKRQVEELIEKAAVT